MLIDINGYEYVSMLINGYQLLMVVVPCVPCFWTILACSTLSVGSFSKSMLPSPHVQGDDLSGGFLMGFAGAECLFPSLDFTNENRNLPLQKLSMQPFPGVFNPWNIYQMCFFCRKTQKSLQVCGPHRVHQRGPEVLHRLHRSLAAPVRFLRAKNLQWKKPGNKNFQVVLGKNLTLINASSHFLWLQSLFIPIQIHVSLAQSLPILSHFVGLEPNLLLKCFRSMWGTLRANIACWNIHRTISSMNSLWKPPEKSGDFPACHVDLIPRKIWSEFLAQFPPPDRCWSTPSVSFWAAPPCRSGGFPEVCFGSNPIGIDGKPQKK